MTDEQDIVLEAENNEPPKGGDVEIKVAKLRDEIESLRKEKQEYLDGWQRAKADYVNALKRFEGDVKNAKADGVVKAIDALLPAYDALERAKAHGAVPEGFSGIVKQLDAAFVSLGLEPVGQVGEHFNPVLHEAMGQDVVTDQAQDDTVTAVLEKGLRMGDQIIRPAKVRVAHFS
jgi:molecular chaperone GrpE